MITATEMMMRQCEQRGVERFLVKWLKMTATEREQYVFDHPMILLCIRPESRDKALRNLLTSDFVPYREQ